MKELYNITKNGGVATMSHPVPNDSHKSFYGKCYILHLANGAEVLVSYSTPVIFKNTDGKLYNIWGGWSATTGRHIAFYCGENKRGVNELPRAEASFFHNNFGDVVVEKITEREEA